MLRISLRLHRIGFAAVTSIVVVSAVAQASAFAKAVGQTVTERVTFALRMMVVGRQVSYLLPIPDRVDTLSGYLQWRVFGVAPLVVAFWAALAAAGMVRGDEERGLVDHWLSAGVSRTRLLATRSAAFAVASAGTIVTMAVACAAGSAAAGGVAGGVGTLPLLGQGLALWALTLACFGVALALTQLVAGRRAAAGLAAGALLFLFLLDSLNRTGNVLRPLRRISPFWYYDRTNAMVPDGHLHVVATASQFAAAVALVTLSAWAFVRRDAGGPLLRRRPAMRAAVTVPSGNPMLRTSVLETAFEQRIGLTAWVVGTAIVGMFMTSLVKPMAHLLETVPALRPYLAQAGIHDPEQAMIGVFGFGMLELLVAVYAITQVARWASDDGEGRLEMRLSAPVHRWEVVMQRAAALAVCEALIVAAAAGMFSVAAAVDHISLGTASLVQAAALVLPFGLVLGAVGAALTGWLPRTAVPLITAVAVMGWLVKDLAPLFGWPQWVLDFSIFQLYGTPLATGVYWTGLIILLAVTVGGFAVALVTMQRRDVGS
jgi:ABC-2 type transport system permease protein